MRKLSSFLLICFVLLCSGCATIRPALLDKPIERNKVYNKPYDVAWKAAMSVFVKSSGTVITTDKGSGVIGLMDNLTKDEMKDFVAEKPPVFPIGAHFGQGQMYVNAILERKSEDATSVFLKTRITGSLLNAYGYPIRYNIAFTSNGDLEREFFKKLSAELGLTQYDYLEDKDE